MSYTALAHVHVIGADPSNYDKDKKTISLVQGSIAALSTADPEPTFVALAQALKTDSKAYGSFGPKTRAAVGKFNAKYGWPASGEHIDAGTLDALKRSDVQKLIETVTAQKDVVAEIKGVNDQVKAAADAKAVATTADEKARAQTMADQAQAHAADLEKRATAPDVVAAAKEVKAAAQAVDQAKTPAELANAKDKAAVADAAVKAAAGPDWTKIGIAAGVGLATAALLGGGIYFLTGSKIVASLVGLVGGAAGGATTWIAHEKGVVA